MPLPPGALRTRVALAAWLLLAASPAAWAQESASASAGAGIALRATPMLAEAVPQDRAMPLFASGDHITGRDQLETVIEGHAELRRPGLVVRADRIAYDGATDLATAQGNVRINSGGNDYGGTTGEVKVQSMHGFLLKPTYQLLANGGYGQGRRVDFIDPDRATLHNADYTTCRRGGGGPNWLPDWILRSEQLDIDQELGEGHISGGTLDFKGVPVPMPSMSFPLTEKRESGWLAPTPGYNTTTGLSLAVPYYWNIAPNRDATLIPQVMSKRGLDLGGQFRYLETSYSGIVEANLLPDDRLRNGETRWSFSGKHNGAIDTGSDLLGSLGLNLNINRVSDRNYWIDFPQTGLALSTQLLPNDASLSWSRGDFSLQARTLTWQVLNTDALTPLVPPYNRSPELTGRWTHSDGWGGLSYAVEADDTRFTASPQITNALGQLQPNANRSYVQAQVSRPFTQPWGFFTPQVQLHASHYDFTSPLVGGTSSIDRTIPTLSLDSGLTFDRNTSYFGRAFDQTLEPRLKYVYTPYRNQSMIPVYDTGAYDFNFASIWADNAYVGHDRIADNNLATAGLTSRLLDPDTGAEALRLGIAQRYRFTVQQVTLPGSTPASKGVSDTMLGASVNWVQQWGVDTVVAYNTRTHQSDSTTIDTRYSPGEYRTVSVAYRREDDITPSTRQFDIGWQWPLNGWSAKPVPGGGLGPYHWYSVGRLDYDLISKKPVDALFGVEYDAGCWVASLVFSKLQTSTGTSSTGIMFQIQFTGLSSVGSNPLRALQDNIPNYHMLRQEVVPPSRFTNYD